MQHLFSLSFFMSSNKRSIYLLLFFLCSQKAYFSQILCTNLLKCGSVSGVTTICLMQCHTSPSHRVNQVVDCGLWTVSSLLFNGSVKLLDIGRNCNTLSYTPIQSIPNMLNGWHVWWVCRPSKNWDASGNCVQIFTIWSSALSCCNMRWWWRMNSMTMGIWISSRYLCAFKLPSIKCICVSIHSLCLSIP